MLYDCRFVTRNSYFNINNNLQIQSRNILTISFSSFIYLSLSGKYLLGLQFWNRMPVVTLFPFLSLPVLSYNCYFFRGSFSTVSFLVLSLPDDYSFNRGFTGNSLFNLILGSPDMYFLVINSLPDINISSVRGQQLFLELIFILLALHRVNLPE